MKRTELIKLKKLLQQETLRRNRIKELLSNNLIQEFMLLNNLNLRHNNLAGKYKKEYVVNLNKEDIEKWYDKLYDMILGILTLNDYLDVNGEIKDLNLKINTIS